MQNLWKRNRNQGARNDYMYHKDRQTNRKSEEKRRNNNRMDKESNRKENVENC